MPDNGGYPADTCHIFGNDRAAEKGVIRCDAFGCDESHPLDHDAIGDIGFEFGRWLGWIYIDLNRPDLFERPLRFCSCSCACWWLEREVVTRGKRPISPLDIALSTPSDQVRNQAALRWLREQSAPTQSPPRNKPRPA